MRLDAERHDPFETFEGAARCTEQLAAHRSFPYSWRQVKRRADEMEIKSMRILEVTADCEDGRTLSAQVAV